jgi:histidine triad (HIT) family protein
MDCIFCKISSKEASSNILFEDDVCLVIETREPVSKGHVLVIPKKHSENILDISDSDLAHLAVVSKQIGKKLILKTRLTV